VFGLVAARPRGVRILARNLGGFAIRCPLRWLRLHHPVWLSLQPLRELTGATPGAKTAWAIGLQRIVPGVGFQSWTAPASADIQPQGFGYLLFE